jgi:hypothetical protein
MTTSGKFSSRIVGIYNITAKSGKVNATVTVQVTPGRISKAEIAPKNATLKEEGFANFTVTSAFDAGGNAIPLSNLTIVWDVDNSTIGSVDQTGHFTAKAAGLGHVVVEVSFGGATVTLKAEVNVTAKPVPPVQSPDMTPYFILVIILLIAVVLFAILLKRKRTKTMVEKAKKSEDEKRANDDGDKKETSEEKSDGPPKPVKIDKKD